MTAAVRGQLRSSSYFVNGCGLTVFGAKKG